MNFYDIVGSDRQFDVGRQSQKHDFCLFLLPHVLRTVNTVVDEIVGKDITSIHLCMDEVCLIESYRDRPR